MAGERRHTLFDRPSPSEENQEEQNTDAGGHKSQQEELKLAAFLPLDNFPKQIRIIFGT
jgi:hypothetical protein